MDSLDTLRRTPWVAVALVAIPAALWLGLREGSARTRDAITLHREWRTARERADRADEAPQRLLQIQAQTEDAARDAVEPTTLADALSSIESLAGALALQRVEPGTPVDSGAVRIQPLTLTLSGAFPHLGRFVDAVETGAPPIRIRQIGIHAPVPSAPGVEAVLEVDVVGALSPRIP